MASGTGPRRARGEIERLPSGSLRVRVYLGIDPATRKRRYLVETVPAGPEAAREAEGVRDRLLARAEAHRRTEKADRRPTAGSAAAGAAPAAAPGRLTMAAIARLAGVSAPTVSKVLNGRAGVAPETRRRVQRLLHEEGYQRPDKIARAACVELVFYGMQGYPAVEIMRGAKGVAVEHGLSVGFTDVEQEESAGLGWAEHLLAGRPTGVIIAHMGFTPEQHGLLSASGMPMVVLDPVGESLLPVPSVASANRHGGIAAARHLLDLGHRRIAVVTGPLERLSAAQRLDGARAAAASAGVPLDKALVRKGRGFAFEDGLEHGTALLRMSDPPTAVLCGNDLQAFGVFEAARRAGVRIPDDLSVVGFDDISHARWTGPALTSVRQPFRDLGATAANLVLALAEGETVAQSRIELMTTLVVRDSTAPPTRH
ncbi:LacI family DNA-binding transcriptional regulator [Glycomyces harbinensis]|uniref:LacI family transcriptional regulator, xylobiose transport system transcriptional regulator n=1 Tax=Glycomyces harbinensis TaxID=58114 RepID=A0A1G6QVN1_9ACTN|nr:LacI family DNA-binding transcriptional regulator [Glycomyces harbinensis]SDC96293.1 LacI family transcriptional regulator, xylobiose transport system transcriptional regulator [Glycomyces harbinensis]